MSTADVKIDHDASCDGKVRLGDVTRNLELLQLWQYDSLLSSRIKCDRIQNWPSYCLSWQSRWWSNDTDVWLR